MQLYERFTAFVRTAYPNVAFQGHLKVVSHEGQLPRDVTAAAVTLAADLLQIKQQLQSEPRHLALRQSAIVDQISVHGESLAALAMLQ